MRGGVLGLIADVCRGCKLDNSGVHVIYLISVATLFGRLEGASAIGALVSNDNRETPEVVS